MSRKIRMVSYGLGRMGKVAAEFALVKGIDIVAAYDMYDGLWGKDIGEHIGKDPIGVTIRDSKMFAEEIKNIKPDICVIIGKSFLKDLEYPFTSCAEAGVNAVTIGEEMFYPFVSTPSLASKLDSIAKENGCTLTGTGGQEFCWATSVATMASACNTLKKIEGYTTNDLDLYGPAFAAAYGIGLTEKEFEERVAVRNVSDKDVAQDILNGTFEPALMWNSHSWLCDNLGYKIRSIRQEIVPTYATEAKYSKTLERNIEPGQVIKSAEVVTLETMEGLVITGSNVAQLYEEGEYDVNQWKIYSEDNVYTMDMPDMPAVELTLATVMNRIPDIINAEPGLVPTSRMPACKFRKAPMRIDD